MSYKPELFTTYDRKRLKRMSQNISKLKRAKKLISDTKEHWEGSESKLRDIIDSIDDTIQDIDIEREHFKQFY